MIQFQGGQDLHLYVTVSDGDLKAKTEVYVNVLNSSAPSSTNRASYPGKLPHPPSLFNFPNYGKRPSQSVVNNPPPAIANNPPPQPNRKSQAQEKTYPEYENSETPQVRTYPQNTKTHLLPVAKLPETTSNVPEDTDDVLKDDKKKTNIPNNDLSAVDQPVKSASDLTITLAPVVSVCAIFLVVGIVAFVFRKKICFSRTKSSKDDMVSIHLTIECYVSFLFQNTHKILYL